MRAHRLFTVAPLLLSISVAGCLSWSRREAPGAEDGAVDAPLGTDASEPVDPGAGELRDGGRGQVQDAGDAGADRPAQGTSDGGRDAGSNVPFCTTLPSDLPCADFDSTRLEDWSWTELGEALGTSLTVEERGRAPGDHVLRAATAAVPEQAAMAVLALPTDLSDFDLAFDIETRAVAPASGVTLFFKLQADVPTGEGGKLYPGIVFGIGSEGTFIAVDDQVGPDVRWDQRPLPPLPSTWTRVRVRGALGPVGWLSVQYDDGPVQRFAPVAIELGDAETLGAKLGVYSQGYVATEALIDNATILTTPSL